MKSRRHPEVPKPVLARLRKACLALPEAYEEQAEKLAGLFKENFKKFETEVEEEVKRAGPR